MRVPKGLAIAAAALVVAAAVSGYCVDAKFRAWNERVEKVEEFAKAETARANAEADKADEQKARADSAVTAARNRAPEIRERIVRVREESPPDPARDSIIDDLAADNEQLVVAYDSVSSAYEILRVSYNSLLVVNDSLSSVLSDRPRPRSRWAPSIQAGVFAGICSDGRPCVGVGAGLTVEIKIPTPRLPWDG
jgi:hypothetical protein